MSIEWTLSASSDQVSLLQNGAGTCDGLWSTMFKCQCTKCWDEDGRDYRDKHCSPSMVEP